MALSLAKELSRSFVVTLILLTFCTSFDASSHSDSLDTECLSLSSSEFVSSIRTVLHVSEQVVSILSKFSSLFGDFRSAIAVSDCLDLLDLSSDALSWVISAVQNPNGKHNSTGNLSSDLRTWLSSVIMNPQTCLEGFEGTNGIVKGLVSGGLTQVSSSISSLLTHVTCLEGFEGTNGIVKGLVSGGLTQVSSSISSLLTHVNAGTPHFAIAAKNNKFPHWVKPENRKLLQANGAAVDVIVAADGTGNFTNINIEVQINNAIRFNINWVCGKHDLWNTQNLKHYIDRLNLLHKFHDIFRDKK